MSSFSDSQSSLPILWRRKTTVQYISATLSVLFILAVSFQVCAMVIKGNYSQVGAGIWCGIIYGVTSALSWIAVRKDDKAMTIGLLWMAVTSACTSLILMILAALSLTSANEGNKHSLWIASNAILVGVGVLGTAASVALAIVVRTSITRHKQLKENHSSQKLDEIQKQRKQMDTNSLGRISSNEILATPQPTIESNSTAGSGIYESIESKQGSMTESIDHESQPTSFAEPIYAVPVKKNKSSTSLSKSNDDFEIQLDERRESQCKVNVISNGNWHNMEPPEEFNSDVDDSQLNRNIELPKEDVIIHAPPPDTRSPVL